MMLSGCVSRIRSDGVGLVLFQPSNIKPPLGAAAIHAKYRPLD
jgi:hypothetical protein